jgi:hypothetical protein
MTALVLRSASKVRKSWLFIAFVGDEFGRGPHGFDASHGKPHVVEISQSHQEDVWAALLSQTVWSLVLRPPHVWQIPLPSPPYGWPAPNRASMQ